MDINILIFGLNAVLPLVILMFLGYFLRRVNLITIGFIRSANKFVFRVALPISLCISIYDGQIETINWSVVLYCMFVILVLFLIGLISVVLFCKDNRRKGVILQSVYRSNFAVIGVAMTQFISQNDSNALATAAVIAAFVIPLFAVLTVLSFTMFIKTVDGPLKKTLHILKKMMTNPLLLGILSGVTLSIIRPLLGSFSIEHDLAFIYTSAKQIGAIAAPLALICLGAAFAFSDVSGMFKDMFHAVIFKNFLTPVIALGGLILFMHMNIVQASITDTPAIIALFCAPAAVTTVVMASEMKSDEVLAGQVVVWSSVLSIITIFLGVVIFKSLGLV